MRLLGKSYENLGNIVEAEKWYRLATAEDPHTREPWVELAMISYLRQDWMQCYFAASKALEIKDKALVYTMDPTVWTERPYDLASLGAWHLGLKDEAVKLCKKALEFNPTDTRLLTNLSQMEEVT